MAFMTVTAVSDMALASSGGQFQSTLTVQAGCSVMGAVTDPGLDYLCSPNVGDFRLSLDTGLHGEGRQRYLSDGQTRIPYRLQVYGGQGERLSADRVLSISLPSTATTLMLQAFNTPVAASAEAARGAFPRDTVLATFEY